MMSVWSLLLISGIVLGCYLHPSIAQLKSDASDRKLTPQEFIALGGNADEYDNDVLPNRKRNGIQYKSKFWPNGVIPYVIDSNMNSHARSVLQQAINIYHQKTCIRWVQRTNQRNYVLMTKPADDGCNSHVGTIGGMQKINFPDWCINSFGSVIHEMMHAAGFHHEQNRPDRDSYITVYYQNVQDDAVGIFHIAKGTLTYGTQYDYGSIMHYGASAFSKNGQNTLVPKNGVSTSAIGQRNGLSTTDVYKLRAMYQCDAPTSGGGCADKHESCSAWASRNPSECENTAAYMLANCEKSCQVCGARLGCYMKLSGSAVSDTKMTPNFCKRYCRLRGHAYAGLKGGNQCICGSSLGLKGIDSFCRTKCVGDQAKYCGGRFTVEVFRTS